jgi:signal transduction histidine kinase
MQRLLTVLVEQHDLALLSLAGLICLLACFTAFNLAVRPVGTTRSRTPWLVAAAVVTGCGAWATHLVALLAFEPDLPAAYNPGLSVLSGLIALMGCSIGFLIARAPERMAIGGAVVGLSIAAMVYVGLASVSYAALKEWDSLQVAISLLVATGFAAASRPRAELMPDLKGRLVASALLATAILGTHFCAVAALHLQPRADLTIPVHTMGPLWFTIAVTATVLLIAGLGLVGALIDQHVADFEAAKHELESALRRADAANASKSMFLANMSHELRTPLNAIIGFSEIMREEMFGPLGGPRYREYVDDICKCGNHLLALINDVLDMSKFDAGRLELHEEKVDLHEIVAGCINTVRPGAEKAQVTLAAKLDAASMVMHGDGRRLKQIVLNLLSNAIKFTPEGGRVTVSVFAADDGLTLTVADTGIGMTPEQIPKALERFGQIDSRLARRHEGTGLGLPLTKCLVELHGGTLGIHSRVNVGTTVTVSFPAARLAEALVAA